MSTEIAEAKIVKLEEVSNSNDFSGLDEKTKELGKHLDKAFHDKGNPDAISDLVRQGAPVNYRLDYGLEIRLESYFVYEFFLLLNGDKGEEELMKNAKKLVGDEHALGLVSYVKTAKLIFDALNSPSANQQVVPVSEAYKKALRDHAVYGRANPEHQNGSLIIAAGLRDPELVKEIIEIGRKNLHIFENKNGARVNFKGYFGDTPAVWSAILLDFPTLKVLVDHGAQKENLGVGEFSLLHWITVAVKAEPTKERIEEAKKIAELLIKNNLNIDAKDRMGRMALDYAEGEFKTFLEDKKMQFRKTT